jgi:hypothetical protein
MSEIRIYPFWPAILFFVMLIFSPGGFSLEGKQNSQEFPVLKGEYLGQKPPGMKPELFAPGIISTGCGEGCAAFTPDGKEFYFILQGKPNHIIMFMKQLHDQWTEPRIVPFSGRYNDVEVTLSPGGNKLFFPSRRPLEENGEPKKESDIWVVERTSTGWGIPKNLGPHINSDKQEAYPSLSGKGNLYFSSNREGGKGGWDIYMSKLVKDHYTNPLNIGSPINTRANEWDAFLAPDESYIIFGSEGRDDGYGGSDLYISFRKEDGAWTKAINMGEDINSNRFEICPSVSPDGKYIFFTSLKTSFKSYSEKPFTYSELIERLNRPGNGASDIYWLDAKIIEQLKMKVNFH